MFYKILIILIIGGLQGGIRKELDSYDSFFHNFKQSEVKPLPLFYILAAIELIFYYSLEKVAQICLYIS